MHTVIHLHVVQILPKTKVIKVNKVFFGTGGSLKRTRGPRNLGTKVKTSGIPVGKTRGPYSNEHNDNRSKAQLQFPPLP